MQLQIETVFGNKISQPEEHDFPIVVGRVLCGMCLIHYYEPFAGVLKTVFEGFPLQAL
jgi:hypothetical protein